MKCQNDLSGDLVLDGLLCAWASEIRWRPQDGWEQEEQQSTIVRLADRIGATNEPINLATLLGVPSRASRWVRDVHLRKLIESMPDATVSARCTSAATITNAFFAEHESLWRQTLATLGKRPPPLRRATWLANAIRAIPYAPRHSFNDIASSRAVSVWIDSGHFQLLVATAQGQVIPRTARGLYNFASKPANALVTRIERSIVESYRKAAYEATRA